MADSYSQHHAERSIVARSCRTLWIVALPSLPEAALLNNVSLINDASLINHVLYLHGDSDMTSSPLSRAIFISIQC